MHCCDSVSPATADTLGGFELGVSRVHHHSHLTPVTQRRLGVCTLGVPPLMACMACVQAPVMAVPRPRSSPGAAARVGLRAMRSTRQVQLRAGTVGVLGARVTGAARASRTAFNASRTVSSAHTTNRWWVHRSWVAPCQSCGSDMRTSYPFPRPSPHSMKEMSHLMISSARNQAPLDVPSNLFLSAPALRGPWVLFTPCFRCGATSCLRRWRLLHQSTPMFGFG